MGLYCMLQQRSIPEIVFPSYSRVYTRSLTLTVYTMALSINCLYMSLIQLFITGGDLNHTSGPGAASAWAAGTLLQSDYGGAFWMASWKRVSLMKALSAAGWWSQSRQPWAAGPDVRQRLLLEGRHLWRRWYPGVGRAAAAAIQFQTSALELPQPLV